MSVFRRHWLWPVALAAGTVFGLLSALIGEGGVWWGLCWLTLSMPLATIVYCLMSSQREAK